MGAVVAMLVVGAFICVVSYQGRRLSVKMELTVVPVSLGLLGHVSGSGFVGKCETVGRSGGAVGILFCDDLRCVRL